MRNRVRAALLLALLAAFAAPASADEGHSPLALLDPTVGSSADLAPGTGAAGPIFAPPPQIVPDAPEASPLAEPEVPPRNPAPRATLTVTLGGDLGLNPHNAPVEATGTRRHGRYLAWPDITAHIRPLLDGDLNFANLETVVTDRNDLAPAGKAFNFRSHPAGVRHLAEIGFNLLSTANNHAIDYGIAGLRETLASLDRLQREGVLLAHAGVGMDRASAAGAHRVEVEGVTVALAALGIDSGGRAGQGRPGLMGWRAPDDVADVIAGLARAPAAYRILSVHQGQERSVRPDADAIRKLRHQAVLEGGVDLVAGHHAHVVQGIEVIDGRLVFYGLGNLLHPGMQDMSIFGLCQDYGLFARVHLVADPAGRLRAAAVEAIPLTDMHWQARPLPPERAADRIHVLNHLAADLDDARSGARGVRFAVQADGSGLYCAPEAGDLPGRAGRLCTGWAGPAVTSPSLKARIRAACNGGGPAIARSRPEPSGPTAATPAASLPQRSRIWTDNAFSGN